MSDVEAPELRAMPHYLIEGGIVDVVVREGHHFDEVAAFAFELVDVVEIEVDFPEPGGEVLH